MLVISLTNQSDKPVRYHHDRGYRVEIFDETDRNVSAKEKFFKEKSGDETPQGSFGFPILDPGETVRFRRDWQAADDFVLSGHYKLRVCRWDGVIRGEACSAFQVVNIAK
jgi:hypothetical protein